MKNIINIIFLSFILISCSSNENNTVSSNERKWVATPGVPDFGNPIDSEKPNILILGDSISVGYTGAVNYYLKDKYDVRHPADNCRNSYYTLHNIDRWIETYPNNSIITWNNGVWDIVDPTAALTYINAENPKEWYTVTDEEYEQNIIKIANKLKLTGARIIFFTTTDVTIGASGTFTFGRETKLNEIAMRVLPDLGIEVYDLNSYAMTLHNAHGDPWEIHFSDTSNDKIGLWISNIITGVEL